VPFYKIAIRERTAPLNFLAVYELEAPTPQRAIEAAKERFRAEYPDKAVDDHSFERDRG
jgi:hypothetical protein